MRVGRERLRQILIAEGITFQRTKTWKESPDPLKEHEAGPDRVAAGTRPGPDVRVRRVRAVDDQTGRRRRRGRRASNPQRLRANYHKPHGSRQFYACYSIGDDQLCGHLEPCKGSAPTLRALQAIRASVDDGEPIHVILDNLNHHKNRDVRDWCEANNVELVFTPTYALVGEPDRGALRAATPVRHRQQRPPRPSALARAIRSYLRWRNTHTRDPAILDAERRHRARIRSEATTTMGTTPTRRRITRERSWSEH